jgi:hypothetical protein
VLIFLFIFSIVIVEGRWRQNEFNVLVDQLSDDYPKIYRHIEYIDPSWIPFPWEQGQRKNDVLMKRISARSVGKLNRIDFVSKWTLSRKKHFDTYLKFWWGHKQLCAYMAEYGSNVVECNSPHSFELNNVWRAVFVNKLDRDYYINVSGKYPQLDSKLRGHERVCNYSPLTTVVSVLNRASNAETVEFYDQFLKLSIAELSYYVGGELSPGDCQFYSGVGYGIDPMQGNMLYATNFVEPNKGVWFESVWSQYHLPEIGEAYSELLEISAESQRLGGLRACSPDTLDAVWLDDSKCISRAGEDRLYSSGLSTPNGERALIIGYPSFAYFDTLMLDLQLGEFTKRSRKDAKRGALALKELLDEQYSLDMKWQKRKTKFFLTFDDYQYVTDYNGPLKVGINATLIPSSTILEEPLATPDAANLSVLISERRGWRKKDILTPLYSRASLFEALDSHGNSRKAGIRKLITLAYGPSTDPKFFVSRFRFNLGSSQSFDTNTSVLTGFKYGALFGIGGWQEQQRYAFARQKNPGAFKLGEFGSFLIPYGQWLKIPTGAGKAAKMSKGGKMVKVATLEGRLLSGALEGALSVAYEQMTAPPLQDPKFTTEMSKIGGAAGFAFGFILPG